MPNKGELAVDTAWRGGTKNERVGAKTGVGSSSPAKLFSEGEVRTLLKHFQSKTSTLAAQLPEPPSPSVEEWMEVRSKDSRRRVEPTLTALRQVQNRRHRYAFTVGDWATGKESAVEGWCASAAGRLVMLRVIVQRRRAEEDKRRGANTRNPRGMLGKK